MFLPSYFTNRNVNVNLEIDIDYRIHTNRSRNYNSALPIQGAMNIIILFHYFKSSIVLLNLIPCPPQFQILILQNRINIKKKFKTERYLRSFRFNQRSFLRVLKLEEEEQFSEMHNFF
jgi:hypothetical protein